MSAHHLLPECQKKGGRKGRLRREGESSWQEMDQGGWRDHLAKSLWRTLLCALSVMAGANMQWGIGIPEATLRLWPPYHCHLSVSQPLHLAICLQRTYFLPPHSSSLHYPEEEQGKLCQRGLLGGVRAVSMSDPKCSGLVLIRSSVKYYKPPGRDILPYMPSK